MPLAAIKVPAAGTNLPLTRFLPATPLQDPVVRVSSTEGPFDIQLLSQSAPATVTNFLRYVDAGAYRGMLVHRSDPGFVIQTGALTLSGSSLENVPTFLPVTNEPGLSNLRGTVAMAKVDGDPNSATSQWFINLTNNTFLDAANGGFTVFARVIGGGMSNVVRIASLPVHNKTDISFELGELPLKNYSNGSVQISNLVMIGNVLRLPLTVSSDPNAFTAEITGNNTVRVKFRGFPSNSVSVSVHSYDRATNRFVVSLPVTAPTQKFTGLLQRSNGAVPTLATLSVQPTGTFSGSLANRSGTSQLDSSRLKRQFTLTNPDTGVFLNSLGESIVYWYGHADASFFALAYTNSGFAYTLSGPLMPAAYSGASNDACPLAGKLVNAVLTRTNQLPHTVAGFLQFAFDKAGTAKITGALPDNRNISASSFVVLEPWSGNQVLPTGLFHRTAPAASLAGVLRMPPSNGSNSPLVGALSWTSGNNSASNFDVMAAVWTNRPGTNAISGDTNVVSCQLRIPGIPNQTLLWGPDNKPRFTPTNGMTIRFDAPKGVFSGTATMVATNGKKSKVPYKGVVLPPVLTGFGSSVRGYGLAAPPGTNGPLPAMLVRP
jgi:peptidyl-prolyl cis-trans isomerase A (cyclophilin A)